MPHIELSLPSVWAKVLHTRLIHHRVTNYYYLIMLFSRNSSIEILIQDLKSRTKNTPGGLFLVISPAVLYGEMCDLLSKCSYLITQVLLFHYLKQYKLNVASYREKETYDWFRVTEWARILKRTDVIADRPTSVGMWQDCITILCAKQNH